MAESRAEMLKALSEVYRDIPTPLDSIPDEILAALPRGKSDCARVEKLHDIECQSLEPALLHLLLWFQDGNWPVCKRLIPLLVEIGQPMVPHIRYVLESNQDYEWHWFIIVDLVKELPVDVASCLRPELERRASSPVPAEITSEIQLVSKEVLERLNKLKIE